MKPPDWQHICTLGCGSRTDCSALYSPAIVKSNKTFILTQTKTASLAIPYTVLLD